ncbi:MAG: abscisic acid-deficient protein Aba4 family protein [Pseudomonadota bacterium]
MADTVFAGASLLAIIAWLSLALALIIKPGISRERLLQFAGRQVPLVLCVLYASVLYTNWGKVPNGGFSSLASVVVLFSVPGKMLGGWIHFLAFDLLIGRGVIDHGLAHGYPRVVLVMVLPIIFIYGPLGVLAYLLLGILIRKGVARNEA